MRDLLVGPELERFKQNSLFTPNAPRAVHVPTGKPPLVNSYEEDVINDVARRRASRTSAVGSDLFAAMPRMYTPFEYWNMSKIPHNAQDEKDRVVLYKWLQFFYETHHLIPILIDIFTRFPLVGMELHHRDKELVKFYEKVFFDDLDYPSFLVDLGRMYWTLGNAFALGHWNDDLGVWEEEELLDPSTVKVNRFPIVGGEQLLLTSDHMSDLREIVRKKQPKETYHLLMREFPQFIPFLEKEEDIPVSDVLLKHIAFKTAPNNTYGTPILLRSLRTLMNEEKLMASQDAIAERLYSPFVLVKLGISDMGPNRPPWIPMPEETSYVRDQFDVALASDFRLMVHHFGIEVQNVFGREQMPRLGDDFDRIERRLMQAFGVNPSLLTGGAATQPYASSALQAEFLSQMLRTFQRYLKRHFRERALIVAEANDHFDYERRGDSRIPIEETVLEYDEDGEPFAVKKKKYSVPDLRMKVLDLRDEATQRQFQQALKQQGVPIPDAELAMGMNFDFEEYLGRTQEEMIQKTVSVQQAKVKTYDILTAMGLPVPPDLKAEIEGMQSFQPSGPGGTQLGIEPPGVGQIIMPPPPEGGPPAIGPRNPERGQRPEESDERNPIRPPAQEPTLPGVPGQPGALGMPGAPTPAIQPPPGR